MACCFVLCVIFHGVCSRLYIIDAVSDAQRDQRYSQKHTGLGRVFVILWFSEKHFSAISCSYVCFYFADTLIQ